MKMELLRLRQSGSAAALKPWQEMTTPHQDVARGRYQQAEFAADLWQVYLKEGADEYNDPVEFFHRTYLTDSLKRLLVGAALASVWGRRGPGHPAPDQLWRRQDALHAGAVPPVLRHAAHAASRRGGAPCRIQAEEPARGQTGGAGGKQDLKIAKNCLLVISLPASQAPVSPHVQADDQEVGGLRSRQALDRLQNVMGRLEVPWRPATAEEGFETVRRRLFEPLAGPEKFKDRYVVARAFYESYRTQPQEFPPRRSSIASILAGREQVQEIDCSSCPEPRNANQREQPRATLLSWRGTSTLADLAAEVLPTASPFLWRSCTPRYGFAHRVSESPWRDSCARCRPRETTCPRSPRCSPLLPRLPTRPSPSP